MYVLVRHELQINGSHRARGCAARHSVITVSFCPAISNGLSKAQRKRNVRTHAASRRTRNFRRRLFITAAAGLNLAPCKTTESGSGERDRRASRRDSMGELEVPADALYAAQTQRAVQNFPISGLPMPPRFIHAVCQIKGAAARVNVDLGLLDRRIALAIQAAVGEGPQRRPRRPVSDRRIPDRLRHQHQHECQRSAGHPRLSHRRTWRSIRTITST